MDLFLSNIVDASTIHPWQEIPTINGIIVNTDFSFPGSLSPKEIVIQFLENGYDVKSEGMKENSKRSIFYIRCTNYYHHDHRPTKGVRRSSTKQGSALQHCDWRIGFYRLPNSDWTITVNSFIHTFHRKYTPSLSRFLSTEEKNFISEQILLHTPSFSIIDAFKEKFNKSFTIKQLSNLRTSLKLRRQIHSRFLELGVPRENAQSLALILELQLKEIPFIVCFEVIEKDLPIEYLNICALPQKNPVSKEMFSGSFIETLLGAKQGISYGHISNISQLQVEENDEVDEEGDEVDEDV
jgi:hypothetical protein